MIFTILILCILLIILSYKLVIVDNSKYIYKRLKNIDNALCLPIKIGTKYYPFIVDTGSTNSLINKSIVDKLSLKCKNTGRSIQVHGLNGVANSTSFDTVTIPLHLHKNYHKKANFYVMNLNNICGIIGMDWLNDNKAIVNTKDKKLKIRL